MSLIGKNPKLEIQVIISMIMLTRSSERICYARRIGNLTFTFQPSHPITSNCTRFLFQSAVPLLKNEHDCTGNFLFSMNQTEFRFAHNQK